MSSNFVQMRVVWRITEILVFFRPPRIRRAIDRTTGAMCKPGYGSAVMAKSSGALCARWETRSILLTATAGCGLVQLS